MFRKFFQRKNNNNITIIEKQYMQYKGFYFENYKGIGERVDISIDNNSITTIIGNNESGKTTVLEGIHFIYQRIQNGIDLSEDKLKDIRPKQSAFNGTITVGAMILFSNDDIEKISSGEGKNGNAKLQKEIVEANNIVSIVYTYEYKNNQFQKKYFAIDIGSKRYDEKKKYGNIIEIIKENCQRVELYDDFNFEVPSILEYDDEKYNNRNSTKQGKINWYQVFDNLLTNSAKFEGNVTFYEYIVKSTDESSVGNAISGINTYLNKVITKDWENITESDITIKEFEIKPKHANSKHYEIKVKSNNGNLFELRERSKGCRWFFCFKVLTEIAKNQNTQGTLFLLDEPASNLHIHPQIKILNSLQKIVGNNTSVIYSTHSPSLIQCENIENIYVAKNTLNNDNNNVTLTKLKDYKSDGKYSSIEPFIMSMIAKYIKKDSKFDMDKLKKILDGSGIIKTKFLEAIGKKSGDGTWDWIVQLIEGFKS